MAGAGRAAAALRNGSAAPACQPNEVLRAGHQFDVCLVGLPRRFAPRDQAVVEQRDAPHGRTALRALRHHLGQLEARPAVRHSRHLAAERLCEQLVRSAGVGDRQDRVGVAVHYADVGQKGVKQRLDGRPWRFRFEKAVAEVFHHFIVRHLIAFEQRQYVLQYHSWEAAPAYGLHVRAAALDAHDGALRAGEVTLNGLQRGVAAAPERKRRLPTHQTTLIYKQVHGRKPGRFSLRPRAPHAMLSPATGPSISATRAMTSGVSLRGELTSFETS